MTPTRHIYAIRAESEQQIQDHLRVRTAFERDITSDARTHRLFEWWSHHWELDGLLARLPPMLDRVAVRAGLASRAVFRGDGRALYDALRPEERIVYLQVLDTLDDWTATTHAERSREAQGFIVAELYGTLVDENVPIRAWLAEDLVTIFDELLACRIWDTPCRLLVTRPDVLPPDAPSGTRAKRSHADLDEYAHYVYRHDVAQPRASFPQLAAERLTRLGNPQRAPGDRRQQKFRPDHKAIEYGYLKGKRLLELTIPPERWTAYFSEFCPDRGGTLPS